MFVSLLFMALFISIAPANQQFIQQAALEDWWKAAGEFRIGDTAYQVKNVRRKEGVCSMHLQEGALVPVYSGSTGL